jgi:peptidoglycan/LPS O-acetylase OafA/YrhL
MVLQQRKFIPQIEAMRGVAALVVASYHIGANFDKAAYAGGGLDAFCMKVFMGLSNGYGAVVAFFVMSGFVLARSLQQNPVNAENPDAVRFVRSRIFRLFPAAVFAVLLLTILHQRYGLVIYGGAAFDPFNVLLNMLMIHTDIDRVMWSMKVECVAAPLILISVWLYDRSGPRPLWIAVAVLFGLSFVGTYCHALGDGSNLAPLYAFIVGILVHFRGSVLARRLRAKWVSSIALLSVFVFCFAGLLKESPQTGWLLVIECFTAALLVTLIVWHPRAMVFRPLDFRIVRFYGRISYSFYLLHPLSFLVAGWPVVALKFLAPGAPVTLLAGFTFVVSVLLVTPIAYLSWRYVELPGIALGRAITERRLKRSAAGAKAAGLASSAPPSG